MTKKSPPDILGDVVECTFFRIKEPLSCLEGVLLSQGTLSKPSLGDKPKQALLA
ncbi:hypothetical protein [Streptococcus hyointestinalis]|uniref:hypothetical protein n=1 Tax=Streptococcus hyointestinalis TaxID=1337 RepID=UPI0023F66E0A|nr:hypothetical protein [Streptococcus hyointestinalis]MDD6384952.1 hypothetical protein [Streptococcus hyointestinalis]